MKTLYIDTHSTHCFSLGFFDGEKLKIVDGYDAATQMIKKIMEISSDELEKIIINKGPGSLTGLRIGSSFAQGISLGKNIPLLAISIWDLLLNEFKNADIFFYTGTRKWIKKNIKEELIIEDIFISNSPIWISNKPELLKELNASKNIPFPNCIELMHKYKKLASLNTNILYPINTSFYNSTNLFH